MKILHFFFGHKEETVETIQIEGGELVLFACDCGLRRWEKRYTLAYLTRNADVREEVLEMLRRESSLLSLLPFKKEVSEEGEGE